MTTHPTEADFAQATSAMHPTYGAMARTVGHPPRHWRGDGAILNDAEMVMTGARIIPSIPEWGDIPEDVREETAEHLRVSFSPTEVLIEHPLIGRHVRALDIPEPYEIVERARPNGAAELEAILSELPDTMLPATNAGRADLLASRGVRAPEVGQ